MNYYQRTVNQIKRLVDDGYEKFIIFPFGERGFMVKQILNQMFGIIEELIIDNKLQNSGGVRGIEALAEYDLNKYKILLTSDTEEFYSEIRWQLMKYANVNQFIDLFSPSMFFYPENYYDTPEQTYPRLFALEAVSKEIYKNNVNGDIAECGVYRGWFANHMSRLMPDRKLYLFDTFSGFDKRDIENDEVSDSSEFRKKYNLDDTSVECALNNIGYRANAIVRKGYFPDTAEGLEDCRFAFVSLDTDLYKPIYAGLKFFYPRLTPGGYIFVDDLGHKELLGVRKAIIDFCKEQHIGYVPIYDGTDETAIITKEL